MNTYRINMLNLIIKTIKSMVCSLGPLITTDYQINSIKYIKNKKMNKLNQFNSGREKKNELNAQNLHIKTKKMNKLNQFNSYQEKTMN